jgi:hypothetical protein
LDDIRLLIALQHTHRPLHFPVPGQAMTKARRLSVYFKRRKCHGMTGVKSGSDEVYVLGLCDAVLKRQAKCGHRFDFLRGDAGHRLPVGAYYPDLNLVIEYRERQASETVVAIDKRLRVKGLPRAQSGARYDQRRRDVLPKHGIKLIEMDYKDFPCDARMQLKRIPQDIDVVRGILAREAIVAPSVMEP